MLSDEGVYRAVDTSRLSRVGDAQGNLHEPETAEMLAPDGRHLAFPQTDHLMVLDVADGSWRRLDLPAAPAPFEFLHWLADREVLVFGDDVAAQIDVATGVVTGAEPPQWPIPAGLCARSSYHGFPATSRNGESAHSWFAARRVAGADAPVGMPEVLVADVGEPIAAAFPDSAPAAPGGGRSLGCCPAATWLAPGVPGYLSHGERTRLLAWHAGTDRFERVTEVVGATGEISFADLSA